MKTVLPLLVALLLCACSLPYTKVQSVDASPSLIIRGATDDAILLVDGITIGRANEYNGHPKALRVLPGTHTVSIVSGNNQEILSQKIFVESEMKIITVP